jgi:hypothetical protein
MFNRPLLLIIAFLFLVNGAEAKLLENPETVDYLHAEVVKEGSITLESSGPGAVATRLEIRHTVPQKTQRQSSDLKIVTGSDDYRIEKDDFGNDVIVLEWDNPPLDMRVDYRLVFDVRVWQRDDPSLGVYFPSTNLIDYSQDITEKAYELSGALTTMEKFMALASYVHGLVDYDESYQNIQKSARWVFENKKAVCDGHANLLIAMLRSLGYNAYYVIGYAYTEENLDPVNPNYWGPHGWVEVEYNGKAVSLDPTWLQHPVDATHIKFAISPDSNYTEYIQVISNNVRLNWDKGDYFVNMIDRDEKPRINIESRLVPEGVSSEEHALLITDVKSNLDEQCVLTKLSLQSCSDEGKPFLTLIPQERDLGFCRNDTLYWLLGAPKLDPGVGYTCGVNVYGAGGKSSKTLSAMSEPDYVETTMANPMVLTPSQIFKVNTSVKNSGLNPSELELFMFLEDTVQKMDLSLEALQIGDLIWTLRGPREPGLYPLRFFSSSGKLLEEEIRVIEQRVIEIMNAQIPENINYDESLYLNVSLKGLQDSIGKVRLSIENQDYENSFFLDKGEKKTFTFIYRPDKEGVKQVSIVVLSGEDNYEDGLVSNLVVVREKEWWEPIWEAIRGLLEGIFNLLGMND